MLSCHENKPATDLYQAVPKTSVLIVESNNVNKLFNNLGNSAVYNQLDSLADVKSVLTEVNRIKRIVNTDTLNDFLKNRRMIAALAKSGAEKFHWLLALPSDKDFEKSLGQSLSKQYTGSKKEYSGTDIFSFRSKEAQFELHIASVDNILLVSSKSTLVEEAIRQMGSGYSLKAEADFLKAYNTRNEKEDANIIAQIELLPKWMKTWLPLGDASNLLRFGKWAVLDFEATKDDFILTGILQDDASNTSFSSVFKNISPHEPQSAEIISKNSGLWVSYQFENAPQFYRNYKDYLERNGTLNTHIELLSKFKLDVPALLTSITDNEMGVFYTEEEAAGQAEFAYLKHGDKEIAEQKILEIADTNFIEGYRSYIIRKVALENVLPRCFGRLFSSFHKPYFFITEKHIIFGENLTALKAIINDLHADKTLAYSESYQNFNKGIPSESHLRTLVLNPKFLPLLTKNMEGTRAERYLVQADKMANLGFGVLQLRADGNINYLNLLLEHQEGAVQEVSRQWTVALEHPAANTPQFIENYVNQKQDILIQDKEHQLYLIDRKGSIEWKYKLDGPIIGEVHQIDIYKNNKLQMVLNTENTLYVIDRLGRNVDGFPVKLKASATAAVGVFNYDNARNYRLVVPCGPMLYNYDVKGNAVKGWAFKKAASNIVSQPQHFTVKGKDIIVCLTADGKLYQLNRRGDERFKTSEKIEELKTKFFLKEGKSLKESELLANSNSGRMYIINPEGSIDVVYLDEDHPADHFLYFDESYIFASDNMLIVKNEEHPFEAEMESAISAAPKAMIRKGEFYAAAFSARAEEIRLFDASGELISGFPVFSQGPFDMGSLNRDKYLNIVTYSDDGTVICYRVN